MLYLFRAATNEWFEGAPVLIGFTKSEGRHDKLIKIGVAYIIEY